MNIIPTRFFGEMQFDEEATFEFPCGIPGFEAEREFLFIEQPHTSPLVFIQSRRDAQLCFIAVPVSVADPQYALELTDDEVATLELPAGATDLKGAGTLCCIGLITSGQDFGPTINLASPIVVNLKTRKAVQAVRSDSSYSRRHPLLPRQEAAICS